MSARQRRASYAVWDVAVFVLNVLAFILVGLQLRAILARLDGAVSSYITFAGAVLAACLLVRVTWVMGYNWVARWKNRRFGTNTRRPMLMPTVQGAISVVLVRHARHRHPRGRARPSGRFSRARGPIVFSSFCVSRRARWCCRVCPAPAPARPDPAVRPQRGARKRPGAPTSRPAPRSMRWTARCARPRPATSGADLRSQARRPRRADRSNRPPRSAPARARGRTLPSRRAPQFRRDRR